VALLRLNQPAQVWPLLRHGPDPRTRSYLIHRLSPLGVDASAIIQRLHEEPDLTIHRGLILSLGEFGDKELLPGNRRKPRLTEKAIVGTLALRCKVFCSCLATLGF
jgi:eukaryotic-like serine/threonine-protein kinase